VKAERCGLAIGVGVRCGRSAAVGGAVLDAPGGGGPWHGRAIEHRCGCRLANGGCSGGAARECRTGAGRRSIAGRPAANRRSIAGASTSSGAGGNRRGTDGTG
jgi:hypothetical protein